MWSIFYKYLIAHGLTNLIEVDGLVYAPVNDLVRSLAGCVVRFHLAVIVASLVALGLSWAIVKLRYHSPSGV